jgi:hypothetical protein
MHSFSPSRELRTKQTGKTAAQSSRLLPREFLEGLREREYPKSSRQFLEYCEMVRSLDLQVPGTHIRFFGEESKTIALLVDDGPDSDFRTVAISGSTAQASFTSFGRVAPRILKTESWYDSVVKFAKDDLDFQFIKHEFDSKTFCYYASHAELKVIVNFLKKRNPSLCAG